MKKSILIILMCIISLNIYAKEYQNPMTPYQDNYFISGDEKEDQVKFQFSAKYNLLYPFNTGIYFGYTQLSYWKIYDKSSPFSETNYMPEAFYLFESGNNIFNDYIIPYVDHIKLSPFFHRSTGMDDYRNRSENKYYGEIQLSTGDVYNIGARGKIFGYYQKALENKDINDYHKNYQAEVFFKIRSKKVLYLDKEEISVTWGGNPSDKGYYRVQIAFRLLTTYIQPRIFVQYYKGYDEFMINYNQKTEAIRAGFIF